MRSQTILWVIFLVWFNQQNTIYHNLIAFRLNQTFPDPELCTYRGELALQNPCWGWMVVAECFDSELSLQPEVVAQKPEHILKNEILGGTGNDLFWFCRPSSKKSCIFLFAIVIDALVFTEIVVVADVAVVEIVVTVTSN